MGAPGLLPPARGGGKVALSGGQQLIAALKTSVALGRDQLHRPGLLRGQLGAAIGHRTCPGELQIEASWQVVEKSCPVPAGHHLSWTHRGDVLTDARADRCITEVDRLRFQRRDALCAAPASEGGNTIMDRQGRPA